MKSGTNKKERLKWWKRASRKKRLMLAAGIFLICAVSVWIFLVFQKERSHMGLGTAIQVAQAEMGSIASTIIGTGNLEGDTASSIQIPSGIVIEEVLVESGDYISEGDALAKVNQASVLTAMETIQEQIEQLDKEIGKGEGSSETKSVTAGVKGRIKKIYVKTGQNAGDCMIEQGAMMLLSIDGLMAVDLEPESGMETGDEVRITLTDGTTIEGTVESVNTASCTVTMADDAVGVGEIVTVADGNGNVIGQGSVYIHQQVAVTAANGTVTDIYVSENQSVTSGTKLFALNLEGQSAQYLERLSEREALAKMLTKLISMNKTGYLTAEKSGTIGVVNVSGSSGNSSSVQSSASDTGIMTASYSGGFFKHDMGNENTGMISTTLLAEESSSQAESQEEEHTEAKLTFSVSQNGSGSQNTCVIMQPEVGEIPQTVVSPADESYSGSISWTPEEGIFSGGITYQAQVTLRAREGFSFGADSITSIQTGILSAVSLGENGKTLTFSLTFPETELETNEESDEIHQESKDQAAMSEQTAVNGKILTSGSQISGSVQTSGTGDTETGAGTTSYGEEITAFTILSEDTVILSVSVDELDINSVSEGQEAIVTLDAIDGESFTGTVIKVSNIAGSTNGGVAKYTIKISMDKTEQMKVGMNASATVVIEKKENVVIIPVNALQERGDMVFVYTQTDGEGNLSGETEVATGLSDGTNVEIVKGLSVGDNLYYLKAGAASQSGSDGEKGGFPDGMELPDGMGFPGNGSEGGMGAPSGTPGQGGRQ